MDAMGLLIARGFRFQLATPPEQLKRVPPARLHGRHARLARLIRVTVLVVLVALEAMAVGMQIVSPNPMSVRRCPNGHVQDRMFLPDRNQMNRSGCPYERQ
jgi:hypothetical protein